MILFMPEIKLMQPTPSELVLGMTISMPGTVEMMSLPVAQVMTILKAAPVMILISGI